MFGPKITLRLEYIMEKQDYEPYEEVKEIPITEYVVGDKVPGKPILGLQMKENSEDGRRMYRLYRIADALPVDLGDDIATRSILFKIYWRNFFRKNDDVSAAYVVSGKENLIEDIDENGDQIEWKYILKEENGRYYLVHVTPEGSGKQDVCKSLKNRNINCKKTQVREERTLCRIYGCQKARRPPRSRVF